MSASAGDWAQHAKERHRLALVAILEREISRCAHNLKCGCGADFTTAVLAMRGLDEKNTDWTVTEPRPC